MPRTDHLSVDSDLSRFESIVCGGVAGLLSRFVISPLDVVKIRLQLDHGTINNHRSKLLFTIKSILKHEGVTAFWKGNVPAEMLYIFYGATQFTSYKIATVMLKESFNDNLSNSMLLFLSGSLAGTTATVLSYPLDLLRTRLAAQGAVKNHKVYSSLRDVIKKTYMHEGVKGFFRGIVPSICSITPHNGVFFLSYELTRQFLQKRPKLDMIPAPEVTAGLVGGALSKTLVFPLDVVRKRLQLQGPQLKHYGIPEYPPNVFKCLKQITAKEGIRGLYKGYAVSLLKGAPTSAVTIWAFERSVTGLRWFKKEGYIFY